MKESVEFRIPTENMKLLPPGCGEEIGYGVTRLIVDIEDPLYRKVGSLYAQLRKKNDYFFTGYHCRRSYSKREMLEADYLQPILRGEFEPAGEECGTIYDELVACPKCGAGAIQVGPLHLPGRKLPKSKDIAVTIGSEIVVGTRFVDICKKGRLSGVEFAPIMLADSRGSRSSSHFQLKFTAPPFTIGPSTRAGEQPFDARSYGRCERGDLIGLNLLSEVTIAPDTVPTEDVVISKQMVGTRRGLLRPQPVVVVSQKAYQVFTDAKLKGVGFEIARTDSQRSG